MANTKISGLTPATSLEGPEIIPLVQSAGNASATVSQVAGGLFLYQDADYTLTNTTASQKLFNQTTNGRLTLAATGLYRVEGQIYLTAMNTTTGNGAVSIIGAGTATLAGQLLHAVGIDNTAPTTAAAQGGNWALASVFATNTVTAVNGSGMAASLNGIFKCTTVGTLIPSIALVTGATAAVKAGSWIRFSRIAPASVYSQGAWD